LARDFPLERNPSGIGEACNSCNTGAGQEDRIPAREGALAQQTAADAIASKPRGSR